MKPRVLYIVNEYPQLSQTYIKAEIEALQADYEISVITIDGADLPYQKHLPFKKINKLGPLIEAIQEFKPQILHTHYLTMVKRVNLIAQIVKLPYTVRAHSFDTLLRIPPLKVNELCLGVLAFPFTRNLVEAKGIPGEKIIDCYPVIDFAMFHDWSPNGDGVLNVGATIPKKRYEDYINLARLMPEIQFDLYAIGYLAKSIIELNERLGRPANINPAVEPEEMKNIYKRHRWLVYTACPRLKTVGWPLSIAEAQAAGLGVCMHNIRPDLAEYVGGAGYLYDSIDELPAILSKPYPDEMREKGFQQAKKSDIQAHKVKLTALWDKVINN